MCYKQWHDTHADYWIDVCGALPSKTWGFSWFFGRSWVRALNILCVVCRVLLCGEHGVFGYVIQLFRFCDKPRYDARFCVCCVGVGVVAVAPEAAAAEARLVLLRAVR